MGKEQNIISDPGKGDNLPCYVANESVNALSYVVCKKHSIQHGAYCVCRASCIDFKAYDIICADTLAVAEMDCSLTEFIKCYKAINQGPPKVDALRASLYKFQLWSFGREKMKFLKLSQKNCLDK